MGWLQTHLESFVRPVLGEQTPLTLPSSYRRFFSPQEMAVIKSMWKAVKRESVRLNKPILLAGRDVYVWEILARRENFPTVFRPDISRLTAAHIKEDYSGHFLFDTGFMGSIPRTLRCEQYTMGSSNGVMNAQEGFGWSFVRARNKHRMLVSDPKQVFPRMKGARSLILKIERTPKYWRRGFWRSIYTDMSDGVIIDRGTILQEQAADKEFLQAALLTIEIYKDSSPAFVDAPVNVTGHYGAIEWD